MGKLSKKQIKEIPKVELHRHLEGTFRLETLIEFAKKKNLTNYPLENKEEFRKMVQMTKSDKPDFMTFLSKFHADWYDVLDDPRRISYEAVEDAASENIFYLELRFSPEHFARNTNFTIEEVIEAVISGSNEAATKYNIEISYIITMSRDKLTSKEMNKYIKKVAQFHDQGIVGVDLAGNEIDFPPKLFTKTFSGLYERTGLYATIHAGEASGPENVTDSIIQLEAKRIGHGINSYKDEGTMDLLLEKDVLLEQCFSSNLKTGVIDKIENHPFPKFFEKNIAVSINSDDPQIQQTNLNDDYFYAVQKFNLQLADFKRININSLKHAFISPEKQNLLIKKYKKIFPTF